MNRDRCELAGAALLGLGVPERVAAAAVEGLGGDDGLWAAPVVVDVDGGVHRAAGRVHPAGWALNLPAIGGPLLKHGGDRRADLGGTGT